MKRPAWPLLTFGAACSVLTLIFVLWTQDFMFEAGLLDGSTCEAFRTYAGRSPMLCVPCAERGCEAEIEKYGVTLRRSR